ncbi:MAG: TlpA family protein disulfide reductase [Acidimicrobiales bacterium]
MEAPTGGQSNSDSGAESESISDAASEATSGGKFSAKSLVGAVAAAGLALVLLLAVFSTGSDGPSDVEEFAALAFLTADGETATLADYQGDTLVVNFFASWCAPCRAELPDFEAVHLANGDRVRFVGVNHDLDEVTWRTFVEETDITFETVFQPNTEIWTAIEAKGTPATAFISPDGELLQVWTGILNEEKLQELIEVNLDKAA